MKILHVYRRYFPDPPGGTAEAIRQIALSLRPAGFESRIFTLSSRPSPSQLPRPEGLVNRARAWFAPASCDIGGVGALVRFRRQARWADLIHYHFPWPFADCLRLAAPPGKPAVMTYHSDIVDKGVLGALYQPLQRRMLQSMDAVVATSPAYQSSSQALVDLQAMRPGRVHVIPLGICEHSAEASITASRAIDLAETFGLRPGGYFLFLGAARAYKGLGGLSEAARGSALPVVMAGANTRDWIARAPSDAHLECLGEVNAAEKMALIEGCRALVLPSNRRSEAFGMVLLEAAMCRKPLISTELETGTSYVNQHNETGLVVPPDDPQRLRDAMQRLAHNPDEATRMGEAARARYERLFASAPLARAYETLYNEVISQHHDDQPQRRH